MRTTVTLDDDLAAYVDAEFASDDISDAEAVRRAIVHAQDCEQRVRDQERQLAAAERDLERGQREKTAAATALALAEAGLRDDIRSPGRACNREPDEAAEHGSATGPQVRRRW
jgi:hypothetical protein